jgi:hypothetical protein
VVILPIAFLIGVQWGLTGLAMSWLIAMPLILAINLPRTCAPLGLTFRSMFATMRGPLVAGVAMYAAIVAARIGMSGVPEWLRLILLSALGAGVYLGVVQLVDRSIWTDARKLVAAVRG